MQQKVTNQVADVKSTFVRNSSICHISQVHLTQRLRDYSIE